jgi:hypothetical protein
MRLPPKQWNAINALSCQRQNPKAKMGLVVVTHLIRTIFPLVWNECIIPSEPFAPLFQAKTWRVSAQGHFSLSRYLF